MTIRRVLLVALGFGLARWWWPAPEQALWLEVCPRRLGASDGRLEQMLPDRTTAESFPKITSAAATTLEGALRDGTPREDAFHHIYDRNAEVAARAALVVARDGSGERRKLALSRLQGIIVAGAVPTLDALLLLVPPLRELERELVDRFHKRPTPALAKVLWRLGGLEAKRALHDMRGAKDPQLLAAVEAARSRH